MGWKIEGQCFVSHRDGSHRLARATTSRVSAFGIDFAYEGRYAFANPFAWAA
jgi:hypothetical protein